MNESTAPLIAEIADLRIALASAVKEASDNAHELVILRSELAESKVYAAHCEALEVEAESEWERCSAGLEKCAETNECCDCRESLSGWPVTPEIDRLIDQREAAESKLQAAGERVTFWHDTADERSAEIVRLMAALSASEKEKENAQHSVEALTCRADQAEKRASEAERLKNLSDMAFDERNEAAAEWQVAAEKAEERARIAEHQPKADSGTVAEMGRQLRATLDRAETAEAKLKVIEVYAAHCEALEVEAEREWDRCSAGLEKCARANECCDCQESLTGWPVSPDIDRLIDQREKAEEQVRLAQAEAARLRESLIRCGRHENTCLAIVRQDDGECDCPMRALSILWQEARD